MSARKRTRAADKPPAAADKPPAAADGDGVAPPPVLPVGKRRWRSRKAEYPTIRQITLLPDAHFVRIGPFVFSMDPESRFYANETQRMIFQKLARAFSSAKNRQWFQDVRTDPDISLRMVNHFFTNDAKSTPAIIVSRSGTPRDIRVDFQKQTDRFTRRNFDVYARHKIERIEQEHFVLCDFDARCPPPEPPEYDECLHRESDAAWQRSMRAAATPDPSMRAAATPQPTVPTLTCHSTTCGQVNGLDWIRRNDYWRVIQQRCQSLKQNMSKCINGNKTRKKRKNITQRQMLTRGPSFCPILLNTD
jgi:hypothetical protein